jgi:hypothetical protein
MQYNSTPHIGITQIKLSRLRMLSFYHKQGFIGGERGGEAQGKLPDYS